MGTKKEEKQGEELLIPLQSCNRRRVPVPCFEKPAEKDNMSSETATITQPATTPVTSTTSVNNTVEHDIRFRWRLVWRPGAEEDGDKWAAPLRAGIKNECLVTNSSETTDEFRDSVRIARVLVGQLVPMAADVEFYRIDNETSKEMPVTVDWWKCVHYGNEFKTPSLQLGLSYVQKQTKNGENSKTHRVKVYAQWSISLVQRLFNVAQGTVDKWRASFDRGSAQVSVTDGNYSVDIPVGSYLCCCNGCVCQHGQRGPVEFLQQPLDPNSRKPTGEEHEPIVQRVFTRSVTFESDDFNRSTDSAQSRSAGRLPPTETNRIRIWLQFNEVSSHRGANPDSTRTFSFLGKFQGLFWLKATLSGSTSQPVWSKGPLITLEKFGEKYRSLLQQYNAAHLVGRRPRPSEAPNHVFSQNKKEFNNNNEATINCVTSSLLSTGSKEQSFASHNGVEKSSNGKVLPWYSSEKTNTLVFKRPAKSNIHIEDSNRQQSAFGTVIDSKNPMLFPEPSAGKLTKPKKTLCEPPQIARQKKIEKKHDENSQEKRDCTIGVEPVLLRCFPKVDAEASTANDLFTCLEWETIGKRTETVPLYSNADANSRPLCYALDLHFSRRVRNHSTMSLFNIHLLKPVAIYDWKQKQKDKHTIEIVFSWERRKQQNYAESVQKQGKALNQQVEERERNDQAQKHSLVENLVYQKCELWMEATSSTTPRNSLDCITRKIPLQACDCGALGDSKFRIPVALRAFLQQENPKTYKHDIVTVNICLLHNGKVLRKPVTCPFNTVSSRQQDTDSASTNYTHVVSQWNLLPVDARKPPSFFFDRSLRLKRPPVSPKHAVETRSGKRKSIDGENSLSHLKQEQSDRKRICSGMTGARQTEQPLSFSTASSSTGFLSSNHLFVESLESCAPIESDEETLDRVLYVLQTTRRDPNDYRVSQQTIESLCAERDLLLNLAWRYRRKVVAQQTTVQDQKSENNDNNNNNNNAKNDAALSKQKTV